MRVVPSARPHTLAESNSHSESPCFIVTEPQRGAGVPWSHLGKQLLSSCLLTQVAGQHLPHGQQESQQESQRLCWRWQCPRDGLQVVLPPAHSRTAPC